MTTFTSFAATAGLWAGTNGFRLMPSDPLHEAPCGADVSVHAGGHVVTVAYSWSHPADGDQDGLLVLGEAGEADVPGGVVAFWGDSWHQSPEARVVTGDVAGGVVTVAYEYAPGWTWTIVVDPTDPEVLRLRMDNVVPAGAVEGDPGGAYPAMVMELLHPAP